MNMNTLLRFFFPDEPVNTARSVLLLLARIAFGGLLLLHGWMKWQNYAVLSMSFPDPLDVGSQASLLLAIFAEVFCSLAVIVGALYRLALIPIIVTLLVIVCMIHQGDTLAIKELALVYLIVFVLLFVSGPGRYAVDTVLARKLIPVRYPEKRG